MVFCCIALVGIAIIYFCLLWLRQIFTWPKPDRSVSRLPGPPRALTGKGALPVYGHTALFMDKAGDMALDFDPNQRQVRFLSRLLGLNRSLGDCFSVFIWGQWRVVIKGQENTKRILETQELEDSWPWNPPVTLLGRSCFGFLPTDEREDLRRLIGRSLSHKQVQLYAPIFGELAEKCMDEITTGQFKKNYVRKQKRLKKKIEQQRRLSERGGDVTVPTSEISLGSRGRSTGSSRGRSASPVATRRKKRDASLSSSRGRSYSPLRSSSHHRMEEGVGMADYDDDDDDNTFAAGLYGERLYKVKWGALRSYTLDLMDGPVLNLNQWLESDEGNDTLVPVPEAQPPEEEHAKETEKKKKKGKRKGEMPPRDKMLLWMERMKNGIDVIKTTFGPEWMYIWMMNEYGRALNARMHLEVIFQEHVAKVAALVPDIRHLEGHLQHDVTTQPIPIWAVRENMLRQAEGILGAPNIHPQFPAARQRSMSAPNICASSSDEETGISFPPAEDGDIDQKSADIFQRQADEYAKALRELDLVMPPSGQESEMASTSPVGSSEVFGTPRSRADSHPGPIRSSPNSMSSSSRSSHKESVLRGQPTEMVSPQNSNPLSELSSNSQPDESRGDDLGESKSVGSARRHSSSRSRASGVDGSFTLKDIEVKSAPPAPKPALYQAAVDDDDDDEGLPANTADHASNCDVQDNVSVGSNNEYVSARSSQGSVHPLSASTSVSESLSVGPTSPHSPSGESAQSVLSPTPSQLHVDSGISSSASTIKRTGASFVNSQAAPQADSDLLSTTSTIQMLEDMDSKQFQDSSPPSFQQSSIFRDNFQSNGTTPPATPSTPHSSIRQSGSTQSDGFVRAAPDLHGKVMFEPPQKPRVMPVLERIMRQHDMAGNGISQVVATELSLLIWMMMDMGNAWTIMALSLLSTDKDACMLVQEELDVLELEYGEGKGLFSPSVLNRMQYLDALIFEAIRLCPANLGGMKKTTATVEMHAEGVQIPKGTNVFFCQPTELKFDLRGAIGKKPEHLGRRYPCVELHGFLPLHGLEVPIMVLQTKVFLISLLQKFTPAMSLRKNFIRRVGAKVRNSLYSLKKRSSMDLEYLNSSLHSASDSPGQSHEQVVHHPDSPLTDIEACVSKGDVSQKEAMTMFTKTPFPEPRRVIHLRPRSLD